MVQVKYDRTHNQVKTRLWWANPQPGPLEHCQDPVNRVAQNGPHQTENQITIKNLNDKIVSVKNQLNEERAMNEVSEQGLQTSIEESKKLKQIHKDIFPSREHES